MIGFAFQNGPTVVPPFGGLMPLLSTNPFSYALPTVEVPPVVYDVATTTVAGNKLLVVFRDIDRGSDAGQLSPEGIREQLERLRPSSWRLLTIRQLDPGA